MKDCFLITSYCDTEKKVKVLNECVDNLKGFDADILLHAHYPQSTDVQKKVNYYLYDYSNPIIYNDFLRHWKIHKDYKLTLDIYDYNYTVLQQIKRGYDFLKKLDYDRIIVINYDIIIDSKLVYDIFLKLENCDVNLLYWGEDRKYNFNSTLLGIKKNVDLDFITMDNYLLNKNNDANYEAETFLDYYLSKKNNIKTNYVEYSKYYKQLIMYDSDLFTNENSLGDPWLLYAFSNCIVNIAQYNDDVVIFFNNINKLIHIKIVIDDNVQEYKIDDDEMYYLDINWNDIPNVDVFIDGVKIKRDIMESYLKRNMQIMKNNGL